MSRAEYFHGNILASHTCTCVLCAAIIAIFIQRKNGERKEMTLVTRPGFEPRLSEPESEVLPLYYRAK